MEQVTDAGMKAWEVIKTNFLKLKDAGLFNGEHIVAFAKDLMAPINNELITPAGFQSILLAQTPDLKRGFICMNALALYLEVVGSLAALLLGRSLPVFFFALVYAVTVAYVLYWLVVCAESNEYKLVAIGLFVIYSLINLVQAMSALVLIVPAIFFFCKMIASLCCAYYAFEIERNPTAGANHIRLKEEDVEDLGVAE